MKKSRFTESQIITVLKETDAGMKVEEVCRKHGISSATYYNWKAKYGGMEASDVKRLKELEEENAKLKKMYADVSLETMRLRSCSQKRAGDSAEAKLRQRIGSIGLKDFESVQICWYWPRYILPPRTRLAKG